MLSGCGEREDGFNTNRHSQRGRWERGKWLRNYTLENNHREGEGERGRKTLIFRLGCSIRITTSQELFSLGAMACLRSELTTKLLHPIPLCRSQGIGSFVSKKINLL